MTCDDFSQLPATPRFPLEKFTRAVSVPRDTPPGFMNWPVSLRRDFPCLALPWRSPPAACPAGVA